MPTRAGKACRDMTCTNTTADRDGYCSAHKSEGWTRHHKGKSASERGYGWAWRKLRQRVLERDNFLCIPCLNSGRVTTAKQVDHICPKARGGDDSMTNLQSICIECHKAKTQRESQA